MPDAFTLFRLAAWHRQSADLAEAEARRLQSEERDAAIVEALELYAGALTPRAAALAADLSRYLATAWPRERNIVNLTESATPKRRALHRIARSRNGDGLERRRIFDIGQKCNRASLRLHKEPGDSADNE